MMLIMITVFDEGSKMLIMVNLIAELVGEPVILASPVELSGGGNLTLAPNALPVDGVTRMHNPGRTIS